MQARSVSRGAVPTRRSDARATLSIDTRTCVISVHDRSIARRAAALDVELGGDPSRSPVGQPARKIAETASRSALMIRPSAHVRAWSQRPASLMDRMAQEPSALLTARERAAD